MPMPGRKAENDDRVSVRRLFRRFKSTPEQRLRAEQRKNRRRDSISREADRIATTGERHGQRSAAIHANRFKRPRPRTERSELGGGDDFKGGRGGALAPRGSQIFDDANQPIGMRVGQRPQEQRVDDAENCRVGADAEREGRDDHERERWIPPEAPQRVTGVLPQVIEPDQPARLVEALLRGGDVAEPPMRHRARLLAAQAVADEAVGFEREVSLDFRVEIVVGATASPHRCSPGLRLRS